MKWPVWSQRAWGLLLVLVPLAGLLIYVALRSGPLAPIPVAVQRVTSMRLQPAQYGLGEVQARHAYQIGPTVAGRVERVLVNVGDAVKQGQMLAVMNGVDLDERIQSQTAALRRAQAMTREAESQLDFARAQRDRYQKLADARSVSPEAFEIKRQEWRSAQEALSVASEEAQRAQSDLAALEAQRGNLQLIAPTAGVVTDRALEPGSTALAGQTVVAMVDPRSVWIHVRFDQRAASSLNAGQPAEVVLRSRPGHAMPGHLYRVEPQADAVTEEVLAKVTLDGAPAAALNLGELAEVTVKLPPLDESPVVANAAVQRMGEQLGVWKVTGNRLEFVEVKLGRSDLEGHVQVLEGLKTGDAVVVYMARALTPGARIRVVDRISGERT